MKYSSKTGTLRSMTGDCAVVTVSQARALGRSLGQTALVAANLDEFIDKPGQSLPIRLPKGAGFNLLLVLGTGSGTLTPPQFRKIANTLADRLAGSHSTNALVAVGSVAVKGKNAYWKTLTMVTTVALASYRFNHYKTGDASAPKLKQVTLLTDERGKSDTARALRHGRALAAGLDFARDLGNQPPNVCNPVYMAKEARKLGRKPNTKVTVLDEKRIADLGMGAFMSVTQGSDNPGRLIVIEYLGGKKNEPPVALVGKGITFDTGGISIKPSPAMDEMKFDMCGAASVLGATLAVIEAKLPINLVTVVAAAENMPSGRASRPGDIVTTMSGQTVEILNTDAEGRLVLCDAITYVRRYKPKSIIDVATLTGACIIALGSHASAVIANDDQLARQLMDAGETSGDRAWQLPLWDEYQSQIKSPFADMANIGGRPAGSITAGCFLSRFAEGEHWAHLDVAGSAFSGGAKKGSTGRPVPLLFQYLLDVGT